MKIFSVLLTAALAGCAARPAVDLPTAPAASVRLLSEIVIPASAASANTLRFGGLSGLASLRDGQELLAISDDHDDSRIERLRLHQAPSWSIERLGSIPLQRDGGAPALLDPEGIALTEEGHVLVSSEGIGGEEPRVPPSITEYSPDGRFVRSLPVRPRYAPNAAGPIVTGVRSNAGFESLTVTPDYERLFTAAELPLAQDGEADAFARGNRTRILEYARLRGAYEPSREFAYDISPLERPSYEVGFAVNGLVELLALNSTELIALERGYVEAADRSASMNRIRIFRIELAGASDISGIATLRGAEGVRPVRKVLVADLNSLPGLSPALRKLDNFEGLAWGPAAPGGGRPLLLISDDNFNARQITALLVLQLPVR